MKFRVEGKLNYLRINRLGINYIAETIWNFSVVESQCTGKGFDKSGMVMKVSCMWSDR